MIDGVVRTAIEEAIRFLKPGATHLVTVNEHEIAIIALAHPKTFAVGCLTCNGFLDHATVRPFLVLHQHTKNEGDPVP